MKKNKKSDMPPMTHEERVAITREAIKLAIRDFLESRKEEFDKKIVGLVKRLFWWFVGAGIVGLFHVIFHGKYQKLEDAIFGAMSQ